jgi:hypothetical protein
MIIKDLLKLLGEWEMSDRYDQLIKGKQVCNRIIQECKVKLPMCKMTYPQGIVTNIQGFPDYTKSIKQAKETLKNIQIQLNSEAVSIPPKPKDLGILETFYMILYDNDERERTCPACGASENKFVTNTIDDGSWEISCGDCGELISED